MTGKVRDDTRAEAEAAAEVAPAKPGERVIVWTGHRYPFDEREFTATDFRGYLGADAGGDDETPVPMFLRFNKSNNWRLPASKFGFLPEEALVTFLQREEDLEVVEVEG